MAVAIWPVAGRRNTAAPTPGAGLAWRREPSPTAAVASIR